MEKGVCCSRENETGQINIYGQGQESSKKADCDNDMNMWNNSWGSPRFIFWDKDENNDKVPTCTTDTLTKYLNADENQEMLNKMLGNKPDLASSDGVTIPSEGVTIPSEGPTSPISEPEKVEFFDEDRLCKELVKKDDHMIRGWCKDEKHKSRREVGGIGSGTYADLTVKQLCPLICDKAIKNWG